jgi:hypothetical protein
MSDLAHARVAKRHLLAQLAGRSGVVGVGIARAGTCYRLRVNLSDPSAGVDVPTHVDGVEVTVRVVGRITRQA